MTAEMLQRASESWTQPLRTLQRTREVLAGMRKAGLLRSQELPTYGPGRNPRIWFLAPGAARIVPEVGLVSRKNCLLRGFAREPTHSLATSSFCAEVERSAGEHADRFEVLATCRDRHFTAKVIVSARSGEHEGRLAPDHVHLIRIDGTPELFFTEVQVETPLIIPGENSPQSIARSFQHKLLRYWSFWKSGRFREHYSVRDLELIYQCRLQRFRTLVVVASDRKDQGRHMRSLMAAISNPRFHDLFLFTTLELARKQNVFTQPIWYRASGNAQTLIA